ncbi:hypothetical protein ABBQ32_013692 [Trebouxia sp. C0010 RCD-2024]
MLQGDIGRMRPVYDAFLAEYPLCYGYWKKYADAEAKYVSMQEASVVYDRGVAAVPYSVELWGHYAMHKQKAGAPVEEVERLFERGLAYVGMDYLSHGLWDKYLAYELGLGAHATVAQLYLRLLRMPIQRLDEYRTRFHEYAAQHSTAELISEQEQQEFAVSIAQKQKEEQAALAQKLQEEQAAHAAAAAQATQVAAEESAATAAQAAGTTDAAQTMDTTAEQDDVVDAVGQEAVAAAGHMVADITAPAAATTADSSAVDDVPPAEAAPDAAAPAAEAPSVLAVPTPDDVAATVMADASAQAAAAVPTATAPLTAPKPVNSSLPLSAPFAGTALAPPHDMPSQQTPAGGTDTDMPQATIPQSDGPGDDPMQDAEAALDAAQAQLQPPPASTEPSSAASLASVTTAYTGSEAMPAPAADATATASDAGGQATDGQPAETAASAAAPVASEEAIAEAQIKAAWLASVDEVWRSTKEEWQRRKPFEDAIKRPYFHVKPLDLAQLQNWSRYLDYIEEKKDIGMIIRLYERCLVACASYPDLWMRYVRWQESSSKAAAQVALERATSVHCKRRPEIQLFAAHFHERHGNVDMARALFKLVTDRLSPTLISGAVQHVNFERRQGSKAAACSVYDKFLERDSVKSTATYAFVVLQYINALHWGFNDTVKAREVYNAALKRTADSLTLWEGIIHFEESLPGPDRVTRVLDLYDRAVAPAQADSPKQPNGVAVATNTCATRDAAQDAAAGAAASDKPAEAAAQRLTDSERELLSLRAVDFVDSHGDASLWSRVESQHAQRFKLPGKVATSPAASRKRSLAEAADASASKAAKTAAAATPAAAAAAYAGAAALPGPPAAAGAQASAAMSGYYASAAPYYQYPQGYPAAQQPYAYPAASAAPAPAYQYQGYYG